MTFDQSQILLISSAAFPLMSGIVALIVMLLGHRDVVLMVSRIGFAGGAVSGTVLSWQLRGQSESALTEIVLPLWTWFSFSVTNSPSVSFGLMATWVKAAVIGLGGGLALIATRNANSQTRDRLSDDAILVTSLTYAAGAIFVFAPNAVQGFMGWTAVSILALILIRLSHESEISKPEATATSSTSKVVPSQPVERSARPMQTFGSVIVILERFFSQRIWNASIVRMPNWLSEQLEVIENAPLSIQLLASALGTFAILLTWLM